MARPAAISAERRQGSDWFAIVDYHTANNAFFSAAFNFGGGTAEGFYDGVSYATDLYDELSSLAPYAISIGVNTNSAGGLSSAYPDMDWQGGFVLREKVPGAEVSALDTDFATLFA